MKLVVGLGNPDRQYNFTRHNFGFLALDFYFKVRGVEWKDKPKFGALWGREGDTIFVKPQEFYNESGRAVAEFARFYKITVADILVVCDDFNLEFGKMRYRAQGSAGGNNGLKSVISALGTEEFKRLRLGTGNDGLRGKIGNMDFVLSKFTPEEKAQLPEILREVANKIKDFIA